MMVHYHEHQGESVPKYMFSRATESAKTPYRACDSVKKLTNQAKLLHPENVRCTKLRKHIVTMSQLLNLQSHELEQLANLMGHDVRIHRVL